VPQLKHIFLDPYFLSILHEELIIGSQKAFHTPPMLVMRLRKRKAPDSHMFINTTGQGYGEVLLNLMGFFFHIGYYENEELAYRMYEKLVQSPAFSDLKKWITSLPSAEEKNYTFRCFIQDFVDPKTKVKVCRCPGVYWNSSHKVWISRITVRGKRYNICSVKAEEKAEKAFHNIRKAVSVGEFQNMSKDEIKQRIQEIRFQ